MTMLGAACSGCCADPCGPPFVEFTISSAYKYEGSFGAFHLTTSPDPTWFNVPGFWGKPYSFGSLNGVYLLPRVSCWKYEQQFYPYSGGIRCYQAKGGVAFCATTLPGSTPCESFGTQYVYDLAGDCEDIKGSGCVGYRPVTTSNANTFGCAHKLRISADFLHTRTGGRAEYYMNTISSPTPPSCSSLPVGSRCTFYGNVLVRVCDSNAVFPNTDSSSYYRNTALLIAPMRSFSFPADSPACPAPSLPEQDSLKASLAAGDIISGCADWDTTLNNGRRIIPYSATSSGFAFLNSTCYLQWSIKTP